VEEPENNLFKTDPIGKPNKQPTVDVLTGGKPNNTEVSQIAEQSS
jgi:hypothetical protein